MCLVVGADNILLHQVENVSCFIWEWLTGKTFPLKCYQLKLSIEIYGTGCCVINDITGVF